MTWMPLSDFFPTFLPLREATPFAPQVRNQASYSANGSPPAPGMADSSMKRSLGQVEDLLRRVMAGGENQALNRTINKFLVDITPYLEQS